MQPLSKPLQVYCRRHLPNPSNPLLVPNSQPSIVSSSKPLQVYHRYQPPLLTNAPLIPSTSSSTPLSHSLPPDPLLSPIQTPTTSSTQSLSQPSSLPSQQLPPSCSNLISSLPHLRSISSSSHLSNAFLHDLSFPLSSSSHPSNSVHILYPRAHLLFPSI